MLRYLLVFWFCASFTVEAEAGPPSTCAQKFIGTWSYPGGTTRVNADGTANPNCFGCTSVQTWTCNGNTYLFSNSGPPGQFSSVLIDSNRMQGNGIIATRISGAPVPINREQANTRSRDNNDPRNCIKSKISKSSGGNIAYNYTNICNQVVTFDIDDCNPGTNFEVECKVTPITLHSKGANNANTNYRRDPNARNHR